MRLKFLRGGRWHTVTENRSTVSNRNGIVRLADYGLGVTSNNAGAVIQYLTDFESANDAIIPTRDIVSKIGWRGLLSGLSLRQGCVLMRSIYPAQTLTAAAWVLVAAQQLLRR